MTVGEPMSVPAPLRSGTQFPLVTVVMPVRNEAAYIERSLGSVLAQTYPRERMEILVADGMSEDGTRELVSRLDDGQGRVQLIPNEGRIAPTGLNRATSLARGDVLVRVDGHCEVEPEYVEHCVRYLEDRSVGGVGGPIETVGETPAARRIAAAMASPFGVGDSTFRVGSPKPMFVDTVAFPAYRRDVIARVGPYDEELIRNQDDEYNFRIRKAGYKLLLAPDIRSRYFSRATYRSLARQFLQYGFYKVRVLQKHPRQMSPRHFVPGLFVLVLLGLPLATLLMPGLSRLMWSLWGAVIALYGFGSLASAVRARAGVGTLGIPGVMLACFLMHLSYGAGFLAGLVVHAHRWKGRL